MHQSATNAADNLFKAIGFDYFGPFDGHDVNQLVHVFDALKKRKGPRLIHIYTVKGKGFAPAESDQIKYHAISKLNATFARYLNNNLLLLLLPIYPMYHHLH